MGKMNQEKPLELQEESLESALSRCSDATKQGYTIAKGYLKDTEKAVEEVSKSITKCIKSLEKGSIKSPEVLEQLKVQLTAVVTELEILHREAVTDLEKRHDSLDSFSITLFGRTMAGKSTLMEILTSGDGKSIGKGSQRTTRDVRGYEWNGLKVTDVPGIAAFEGEDDEQLAFQTANQADLVLFLITDDAPQPVEAECLAQVRRLGKPILGICNVKAAVDKKDDLLLFLRRANKHFDRFRIDQIIQQFHRLSDQHTSGNQVPFEVTHLRSRFLAQQPGYEEEKDRLIEVSRFSRIESMIIEEVVGRGTFLRVKNFVDGSVTPMMELSEKLLDFSSKNFSNGKVLEGKEQQVNLWLQDFQRSGKDRIKSVIQKSMISLRHKVEEFVEDNAENKSAGRKWQNLVESVEFTIKAEKVQKELVDECRKGLNEIAREIKSELSLIESLSADRYIKMDKVFDAKRALTWGTTIVSGGLTIAAVIIGGSNPFGWAAAGVVVIGTFLASKLQSREEKRRKAKDKLRRKLIKNINEIESDLRGQLVEWFQKELLEKQVKVLIGDLGQIKSALLDLASTQQDLAFRLNKKNKKLGLSLLNEALTQLGETWLTDSIKDVARLPGLATMLQIPANISVPGETRIRLEKLLGENIYFVTNTRNIPLLLSEAMGPTCDNSKITIEKKRSIAYVHLGELDAKTKSRVRLAQQISGYHIMLEI